MTYIKQKIIFNLKIDKKIINRPNLSKTWTIGMKNDIVRGTYDNNNKFYMLGINEDVE